MLAFPASRVPDPAAAPPARWGVIGPGRIAGLFAGALARHTRQRVVAVGSRSQARAEAFASAHGIERAYGSYAALVGDPGVDAVYIASPHSEHAAHALLAIGAGKAVLVEKAFTRNAAEAEAVVSAARAAGVLVVEALWTRFLPQTDVIRRLLKDGVLGEVLTVLADFGVPFAPDPAHRLHDPGQAGGALLDLGVYAVSFASLVLGAPERVVAAGVTTATGVDEQVVIALAAGRAHATITTTLAVRTPQRATICGTAARLELGEHFYKPTDLTLIAADGTRSVRPRDPITGSDALCHEAAHLADLLRAGAKESPLLPLDETLAVMRTLDEIRRQIGVHYPGE